ncbi:1,2-phenylacetyl-CoA epoxidase subunit PaaD [Salinilacihabitans rarus]|uniref:1,2-phenylacetyl-CoA epoxidase subunit PaaD n=1 Tax=Salinilacihabitans rarus TaxID=2961596 RepID=UPI0020C900F8|nr:1,2-phenylacetyl-CoA epoxidase subunit PaaD [Salinilacihabitans rarus]
MSEFDPRDPAVEFDPDPDAEATPCAYTEYVRGSDPEDLPATGEGATGLEREVWDALYEVEDPEMPVSIVDLGLIYGVDVDEGDAAETRATVLMTLTYTGCPARSMLLNDVEEAAASPEGVDAADVELVWSPEWSLEMVTDRGKADLREFGLSV